MHRVTNQTLITIAIVLVASLCAACNQSGTGATGGAESGVAATVNGKNIMLSEVDKILSQQAQGQQSQLTPMQLAQARMQVLTGLIQNEVLLQRADNPLVDVLLDVLRLSSEHCSYCEQQRDRQY